MPPTKSKATPATNGVPPKAKASPNSGTSTPVSTTDRKDTSDALASLSTSKPDKKVYDSEQESIKKEIEGLQVKLSAVRDKISLATKSGPGNDRKAALHAELDDIRAQQSNNKSSRGKILDQVKTIQDGIQKKIKDLQTAKAKVPFKTVAEVDAQIRNLEKQVESGNMKLADEKRALQEISSYKRNRRTVESFQAEQDSIDADRSRIEEFRKQLDDPEFKAASDRYDAIRAELDELKKESDEAYASRSILFKERDDIQAEITLLMNKKRESTQQYREAHDRYWNKVTEDRARRAEKARAQRAAEEAQKKKEIAERLRDEASAPAFQAQIEDCQTLVDFFSGKTVGNLTYKSAPTNQKTELIGVPKLELRKVEDAPEGSIALKKKGEEEQAYFIGGKGKAKGRRGNTKTPDADGKAPPSPSTANGVNVPLPTLTALLSLSIPPPSSPVDVPRVIEDLKTKKAWFEANQTRVTAENIAKAEAEVERLTGTSKNTNLDAANVREEVPKEPYPTPKADTTAAPDVPTPDTALEKTDEALEKEATIEAQDS